MTPTTTTATDPVLDRLAVLEQTAAGAHADGRIDDGAADLVARYGEIVRDVLPRISGWGSARAQLLQATDWGVDFLARFMRLPAGRVAVGVNPELPTPTCNPPVGDLLTDRLAVLVAYAASLDAAVADADIARLLELATAIDRAFGPGFRPAYGIGDPAAKPAPDPEPQPDPGSRARDDRQRAATWLTTHLPEVFFILAVLTAAVVYLWK